MSRTAFILIISIVALMAMLVMLREPQPKAQTGSSITLYCAASNRAVIEAIRADYEKEFKRSVQIQYGASQTLLSSIEVGKTGDLYLPADDSFLEIAREKSLISEQIPVAKMQAVIAVAKGNPQGITSLSDLLKPDVRLVQANPDAAAIGKLTRATLQSIGQWDAIDKATTGYRTTVSDVANDLVVGAADAGIVYDAVLRTYPQLEPIHIPEFETAVSRIAIAVIASSKQPEVALHFARYVGSKDRGLKRYAEYGFQVADGDEWADVPEISLFAGSMLRPVIDDTVKEFEKREGVRVNRVFNGCGILVAQMKAGQHPDAYFACDREFMTQVQDLFPSPVDVSENELVILVQKGNPKGIASLGDLSGNRLRVGVGHEKQCAMGWLTQRTLKEAGVQEQVMGNVVMQSPTGDMLVNQLRAGSLDAAVTYLSNAAGAGEELQAIRIAGLQCSIATQPFAVSVTTRYPRLAARLFQKLVSAASRDVFEAEGFRWSVQ